MTAAEEVPAAGHKISPDTFDEPFCVCADEGKADYIGQLQSIHIPAGFGFTASYRRKRITSDSYRLPRFFETYSDTLGDTPLSEPTRTGRAVGPYRRESRQ